MVYRVRMSGEVREWLGALRLQDMEVGTLVGEAVAVLLGNGGELGPPLVVGLEAALREGHPGVALDHAHRRQLALLLRVRQDVAQVAARRKQVEVGQGAVSDEEPRHDELVRVERELSLAAQRLQAEVDGFRVRKEALKAGYTTMLAIRDIDEELVAAGESPVADPESYSVESDLDELLRAGADLERRLSVGTARRELRELRLLTADLRLLFAVDPPDTAILLVAGVGQDWDEWYGEALPMAEDELSLDDDQFTDYDLAEFLAAYFPGREPEIRAGAARLVEINLAL